MFHPPKLTTVFDSGMIPVFSVFGEDGTAYGVEYEREIASSQSSRTEKFSSSQDATPLAARNWETLPRAMEGT